MEAEIDQPQQELVLKLRSGQNARRLVKMRVSVTLLIIGLICGAGSQSALVAHPDTQSGWDSYCSAWGTAWLLSCIGLCISCYAPLPDDVWIARAVILLNAIIVGYNMRWEFYWADDHLDSERKCPVDYSVHFIVFSTIDCGFILMSLVSLCCRGPSKVQGMMWATHKTYFSLHVLWELASLLLDHYGASCEVCTATAFLCVNLVALLLSSCTGLRDLVHSRLRSLFDRTKAKVAAANIAGLIGDCDAHRAFAQAAARFRCIDLTMLTEEEMARHDPDPALYRRSLKVRLGDCDAFISHSWSDDATDKWAALQQWRQAFIAKHGREPRVWIDKCCIDQTNIEADLRCLPIFLNGCREMVVLCGPTYFRRLWCVMELFTHYHLGLFQERLIVMPVHREDQHDADSAAMHQAAGSFDVGLCECRSNGDRHRLMEIIRADGVQGFNAAMRAVLVKTSLCCGDDQAERGSDPTSSGASSCPTDGSSEHDVEECATVGA
jgi:hypothetical protein